MVVRRFLVLSLVLGALALVSGCGGAAAPVPAVAGDTSPGGADGAMGAGDIASAPDASFGGCEPYIAALASCPYQWLLPSTGCPRASCMPGPCATDEDCPGDDGAGARCVLGSCVWCWEDSSCGEGRVCRAGRCIARADPDCPATPVCEGLGCSLVSVSEVPCPVCLCEAPFNKACETDDHCLPYSSHKYSRCVYGRCADCRNDDDCGGGACLAPGVCKKALVHPSLLFGAWMLGWPGGMNHYSLFRFEADGVFRRAQLPQDDPVWMDDIPPFPCDPTAADQWPVIGTWEAVDAASLRIRMVSGFPCDGEPWSQDFRVLISDEGDGLTLLPVDGAGQSLDGHRVSVELCEPSFSSCQLPDFR